jgi:hypothetical protein
MMSGQQVHYRNVEKAKGSRVPAFSFQISAIGVPETSVTFTDAFAAEVSEREPEILHFGSKLGT